VKPIPQPLDRGVQGQREEERDDHPGQDVPRDPDHLEYDGDRDDRQQQRQRRAQPQPDQALRDHARSIAGRSDVFAVRGRERMTP